jgi:hypothetical protein
MKRNAIAWTVLMLALCAPPIPIQAQDKPVEAKPRPELVATTPVKLQIVFAEFDGDKKVKSLPYTIYHNSSHNSILQADFTKLRIGSRVPVVTGSGGGAVQFQYLDIGANLDCRTVRNEDGKFLVQLSVERSWIEGDTSTQIASSAAQQNSNADTFREPIIRNVRSDLYLSLRDGQTVETTAATDPISGRVVRIEVTLNVQ